VRAGLVNGVGTLDKNVIRRLHAAASAAGADAVVIARTVHVDITSRVVQLTIVDVSSDPSPTVTARLGPQPTDKDAEDIAAALRGALDRYLPQSATPPPPPEPPAPPPEAISSSLLGAHGVGFDAELGGAVVIMRHLEARLFARYERYEIGSAAPSDLSVSAGSVSDQWYSARAALALMF
jgi:hypothetical protein